VAGNGSRRLQLIVFRPNCRDRSYTLNLASTFTYQYHRRLRRPSSDQPSRYRKTMYKYGRTKYMTHTDLNGPYGIFFFSVRVLIEVKITLNYP
jgi:hypothetical protein